MCFFVQHEVGEAGKFREETDPLDRTRNGRDHIRMACAPFKTQNEEWPDEQFEEWPDEQFCAVRRSHRDPALQ
jgi:hypothetical protein